MPSLYSILHYRNTFTYFSFGMVKWVAQDNVGRSFNFSTVRETMWVNTDWQKCFYTNPVRSKYHFNTKYRLNMVKDGNIKIEPWCFNTLFVQLNKWIQFGTHWNRILMLNLFLYSILSMQNYNFDKTYMVGFLMEKKKSSNLLNISPLLYKSQIICMI